MRSPPPYPNPAEPRFFWERRGFLVLIVLLSIVPLLWPQVPPMVDLPGHIGRYRVQLDIGDSSVLRHYYAFRWQLIGNLGVDLVAQLLGPLIGIELAVKLTVIAIPALAVAGLLWVAREVHGRVPPTALFAVPFAYNFPFFFGFVNFALSMALALVAFGLWLYLGRRERLALRAALFVPISILIWVVHAFGWGTLGVLAFSAELVRQHDRGRSLPAAIWQAGLQCLSMALPILLMLAWRADASGRTTDWFNWGRKWDWVVMALRDRWRAFDIASLAFCTAIIAGAWAVPRVSYSRNLVATTLFLVAVFILLPRIVFGSAYADMRLVPYLFAIALVAVRFKPGASPKLMRAIAIAGLAFIFVRTGATTASTWLYDQRYDRELAALDHVPRGARMVSFIGRPCVEPWAMSRLFHLPGLALERREAFSNDQWVMEGAQLLHIRYVAGWPFVHDPSQIVTSRRCRYEVWRTIDEALATFPRHAFDYVWLIDPPPYDARLTKGLRPIWRSGTSVLYRVVNRSRP